MRLATQACRSKVAWDIVLEGIANPFSLTYRSTILIPFHIFTDSCGNPCFAPYWVHFDAFENIYDSVDGTPIAVANLAADAPNATFLKARITLDKGGLVLETFDIDIGHGVHFLTEPTLGIGVEILTPTEAVPAGVESLENRLFRTLVRAMVTQDPKAAPKHAVCFYSQAVFQSGGEAPVNIEIPRRARYVTVYRSFTNNNAIAPRFLFDENAPVVLGAFSFAAVSDTAQAADTRTVPVPQNAKLLQLDEGAETSQQFNVVFQLEV